MGKLDIKMGNHKGSPNITESEIEQIALDILHEELGYTILYACIS